MNKFMMLLKRELWEYKGAFFITPLAIAGFTLLMTGLFTGLQITLTGDILVNEALARLSVMPSSSQMKAVNGVANGFVLPFIAVLFFIVINYLLSTLYSDRKDKSVLFWRSLPVSDTAYVLAKLFMALVAVPFLVLLLALLVQLLCLAAISLLINYYEFNADVILWSNISILGTWKVYIMGFLFYILWSAPVSTWLLLVSSYAKSNPFLWATIPVLVIGLLENVIFRSTGLLSAVANRIAPSDVEIISSQEFDFSTLSFEEQWSLLASAEFILGLFVAAAFIAGAIFLRRYKTDIG